MVAMAVDAALGRVDAALGRVDAVLSMEGAPIGRMGAANLVVPAALGREDAANKMVAAVQIKGLRTKMYLSTITRAIMAPHLWCLVLHRGRT